MLHLQVLENEEEKKLLQSEIQGYHKEEVASMEYLKKRLETKEKLLSGKDQEIAHLRAKESKYRISIIIVCFRYS